MKFHKFKVKMTRILVYLREILFLIVLFPISCFLLRKKKIYIISERGNDARDNACHIFKYYRKYHSDIKIYYIIDKNSPDYNNIKKYGNIIQYRSLLHYAIFFCASIKISTHLMGFSPDPMFYRNLNKHIKLPGKIVSLKHGITKDYIKELNYSNTKLDLIIAAARPEYDYMLRNFGYSSKILKYTGFARFDELFKQNPKRQILVMPTWRRYLSNLTFDEVKNSEFMLYWNDFINDKELISILEANDLKMYFYPHYEMQQYINEFKSSSDNIIIANFDRFDVQKLLMESKLLITDYSSVFFDFAYMKKPIIYYQFDLEKYRKGHYAEGYFDYKTMAFGEVAEKEQDLINLLNNYIKNDFKICERYSLLIDKFFPIRDSRNCERIFNEIETLKC